MTFRSFVQVLAMAALLPAIFVPGAVQAQTTCASHTPADPPTDRDILVTFYCATDGANWTVSTNWLSSMPIDDWAGIAVDSDDRVIGLSLVDNRISGRIPSALGSLDNLQQLYLGRNHLTGSIPTALGNLTSLALLELHDNQLTGSIPAALGNLTSLTQLDLQRNRLSGSIPHQLGNLNNISYLYLNRNQLSGSIPHELGNLTNLRWLWLNNNQLTGSIPAELGNLTSLWWLDLGYNRLSGSIPTRLANLTRLLTLELQQNRLSGSIPHELGNLTRLQQLRLNHNTGLIGELPSGLTNLPITLLDIRCTRIVTPANADFQTWLSGINQFLEGSEGCPTTTPPTTPTYYDGPRFVRPGFDKSTRDTLILTLTWEPPEFNQEEVTGYEYKLYEGPPQAKVLPALIDWTGTGNVQEQDIHVQSDALAYTVLLRAVMAGTTTQFAQVYAYVPDRIVSVVLPVNVSLGQNYPNPFNPSTTISYRLDWPGVVELSVYDLTGRTVSVLVDGVQPAGHHEVRFDAEGLPTGTYLYRLQTPSETQTRTMILVR